MPLPFPIPSVEGIQDPNLRRILENIRSNLLAFGGKGDTGKAAVTRSELIAAGLMGEGSGGSLYSKAAKDIAKIQDQMANPGKSAGPGFYTINDVMDFAGLDTGAHQIGALVLPAGARVIRGWYEVLDGFTSGGLATISMGVEGVDTTGILGATLLATGFTAGAHDCDQDGSASDFTTMTTENDTRIIATVGVHAITSGRLHLFLQMYVAEE